MPNTTQSIQAFLNSLSQLPGSILYRNQFFWEALPPGSDGDVLTLGSDLLPFWRARYGYYPALFTFNGTNQWWSNTSWNLTNQSFTLTFRFRVLNTGLNREILSIYNGTNRTFHIMINTEGRLYFIVRNSLTNIIAKLYSKEVYTDEDLHSVYLKYTPSPAAAVFIVDAQDADWLAAPGRLLINGSLHAGSGINYRWGRSNSGVEYFPGQLGFLGFHQNVNTDWQDFYYEDGWPKPINTSWWPEWKSQPKIWNESGDLSRNLGTFGLFTNNGTIKLSSADIWSS